MIFQLIIWNPYIRNTKCMALIIVECFSCCKATMSHFAKRRNRPAISSLNTASRAEWPARGLPPDPHTVGLRQKIMFCIANIIKKVITIIKAKKYKFRKFFLSEGINKDIQPRNRRNNEKLIVSTVKTRKIRAGTVWGKFSSAPYTHRTASEGE